MTTDNSFVDPSSLSLPSPRSDGTADSPHHVPESLPGPSRKRARTEMSAEDRKEARAHRNRIAAQNSRDKRKAQFTTLERRVAELEEENRQLRAGMSGAELQRADEKRKDEVEREKARERENAELKERIRSLEKGWEAVMKVLTAQGLPTNVLHSEANPSSSSPASSSTKTSSTSTPPTTPPSANNTTTTFPVLVPASPIFPITPSPSISNATGGLDVSGGFASAFSPSSVTPVPAFQQFATPESVVVPSQSNNPQDANKRRQYDAVEAWFRSVVKGAPTKSSTALPSSVDAELSAALQVPSVTPGPQPTFTLPSTATAAPLTLDMGFDMSMDMGAEMGMGAGVEVGADWEREVEMQLLDMFSYIQQDMVSTETSTGNAMDNNTMDASGDNTALGLELCGGIGIEWGLGVDAEATSSSSGVGVF